ncbi:hypothetical protein [Cupriavidus plantarum]|uniref:Uncharacterized protein n=1 Tax=Cupriavidus plantarum TaxID=942865 RepID=A0A316EQG9_9BURK|nr:hypothetical protein [Cupriavidus plantarum]NYI02198.1 hypothetical protein [Cupriavidus plantarum]PWK33144.1 hypothetical protein C7419_105138 [Cupriavidus plantarum]REE88840.1 hypothetical protein C7418_4956 [Cupriavidus plantarum]
MVQTTASHAPCRAALPAAAAVLLGAGLACAGNAHASDDGTEAVIPRLAASSASMGEAVAPPIDVAVPVAVALAEPAAAPLPPPQPSLRETRNTGDTRARHDALALIAAVAEDPAARPAARRAQDEVARAMDLAERDPAQVTHARNDMAKWKPVAHAKLDEARGGFDVGGLQVGFGIDRAVYVNGSLAVATSISIPDVSRITAAQAAQLQQALGGVAAAVAQANTAANGAVAAANAAAADARAQAGQAGAAAQATAAGAVAAATGAAGSSASASSGPATGASASATGANGLPSSIVATATGSVTTNGLSNVVQNGGGNRANLSANVGAMANMPATVIQNTLNNQSIQSLMTISASVNTLAAFRAQVANTALNSVIQRMR